MKPDYCEKSLIQNLKDAGCSAATIEAFLGALRDGDPDAGLRLLAVHRRALLDGLHKEQKQIDCLDYLLYKLEKSLKQD